MHRKATLKRLETINIDASLRACHARLARQPDVEHVSEEQTNIRLLRVRRRVPTRINVDVMTVEGNYAGVIRDISRHGAGLTGSFSVIQKDWVALHFSDGRLIQAQVRWHRGNRCGVSFAEPLIVSDALIRGSEGLERARPQRSASSTAEHPAQSLKRHIDLTIHMMMRFLSDDNRQAPAVTRERVQPREAQMVARACRKQGFAWLFDE
jgi:hypothetical protein